MDAFTHIQVDGWFYFLNWSELRQITMLVVKKKNKNKKQ